MMNVIPRSFILGHATGKGKPLPQGDFFIASVDDDDNTETVVLFLPSKQVFHK